MKSENWKNKSQSLTADAIYGKMAPNTKDLEGDLLGIMIHIPQSILKVRNVLQPSDFYLESHQLICSAIYNLDDANQQIDYHTIVEKLKEIGELERIGGAFYIVKLTNSIVSDAHVEKWCLIIKQYSLARKIILFSGNVLQKCYANEDVFDMLNFAEQTFFEINKEIAAIQNTSLEKYAMDFQRTVIQKIIDGKANPDAIFNDAVYTGFSEWDKINGSLLGGGIYIVAGRPGMGKTAFIIQLIINLLNSVPLGFVNGEMTNQQIIQRLISNKFSIDNAIFKREPKNITDEQLDNIQQGLYWFANQSQKLIIESEETDIDRLCAKFKYWVQALGIKVILIDFLQILKVSVELSKYMTERQVINYILEKIRAVAKLLKVPIILLSQLNRALVNRGNKEPNLADLKESGKIEEIAFQVSFLHRPEYYGETEDQYGENTQGLCYQIIAKHRDGELAKLKHRFVAHHSKFTHWNDIYLDGWKPVPKMQF